MGIASTIVDGFFGLAGASSSGGMNYKAVRETNKSNEKINERQLQAAREMQGISNDFTEKMWNQTNEYNNPTNEAQRWRDAGFSPFMMMGNTPAAVAQTGTGGSVPSAIPMQPFRSDLASDIAQTFGGIAALASVQGMKADADLKRSQTVSNDIANKFAADIARGNIGLLNAQANNARASEEWYGAQTNRSNSMLPYDLQRAQNETRQQAIQEDILKMELAIRQKQLPWIDKEKRAQIASIMQGIEESKARAADYRASKKLKDAQRELTILHQTEKRLQNALQAFSEEEQSQIREYLMGEYYLRSRQPGFMGSGLSIPNFMNVLHGAN